jgi:hydrogenase nickel incorporation protein HypA/HybF
MHELGIVFHVIKSVEQVAKENNLTDVASVTMEIGEVSTVIPDYLKDCWKWAIKKSDLLSKADLIMETIPAVTFCEECEKTYETVEYGKICPYCGSERTYLLRGNEINIKEIEVVS